MTEQMAFHEAFGDGGAVQRNQRAVAPGAIVVDRPCDELLARPALTHDADVGVTGGDFVDLGEDLPELLRLADNADIQVRQRRVGTQRSLAHWAVLTGDAIEPTVALGHVIRS